MAFLFCIMLSCVSTLKEKPMKEQKREKRTLSLKQEKGTWKRFIMLIAKSHLPYGLIILFVLADLILVNVGISETDVTAQLFAGDTSVGLIVRLVTIMIINIVLANIVVLLRQLTDVRIKRNARLSVWNKILHIPMSFFKDEGPEEAITRVVNNASAVGTTLIMVIIPLITSLYGMRSNGELYYVGTLMASEEEQYERSVAMPLVDEDIRFEEVSFAYGEENTLEHINCVIPAGKRTAIVGLNGSGKTTMLKLLERFYTANGGVIRYGDTAVEEIHLGEWRQNFGYVLQKPRLFDASIRDNIVYGIEREVSEAEIIAVAKKANAWEFIERIPEGLDFVVGDNGCKLSQGERQRIAIARAIMVDPAYLLLDEATSNVDVASKAIIDWALLSFMEGRTTVFISHNAEEIKSADHVIVLNDKTVEAQGAPEEVMQTSVTLKKILEGGAV